MNTQPIAPILQALDAQGRKRKWLAQATGISAATLYAYIAGRRTVQPEWLAKARVALGIEEATQ